MPEVVAAAPPQVTRKAEDAGAPNAEVQRTEFGVDLGSANSVAGLRALWRGLLKSRSNAPLRRLRPIIVIREGTNGLGMQLRLVAGPLSDAGAAAKICAVLSENNRACETAVFDGQRLSLKDERRRPPRRCKSPRHAGTQARRAKRAAPSRSRRRSAEPQPTAVGHRLLFGRRDAIDRRDHKTLRRHFHPLSPAICSGLS